MTPLDWALRPLKRYAQFEGRAPRAEYWWFYLATLVVSFLLDAIENGFDISESVTGETGYLSAIFSVATIIPWMAVTVRRLHDIDSPGWWLVAWLVPIAILGALAVMGGMAEIEQGSFSPQIVVTAIVVGVLSILLFVFMVLPGTDGPNRYGPDPYGPDDLEEVFA